MFAAAKERSVALKWLLLEFQQRRPEGGGVMTLTFLTGHARFLLQFHTLQVESVTGVSERYPSPVSHRAGALARVFPLVHHRLVWPGEKPTINSFDLHLINAVIMLLLLLLNTHTTYSTDSSLQFSITRCHSPLASGGHVTTSSHLIGLPILPV